MGRLIGVCFQTVYLWEKGLVIPSAYRESTKRLMSLIDDYGSWEEDPLFNQETERISTWQRRMLKKSLRLKEKEKRNEKDQLKTIQ